MKIPFPVSCFLLIPSMLLLLYYLCTFLAISRYLDVSDSIYISRVTKQALPPLPLYGTCLHSYREKISVLTSLVDSHRTTRA